MHIHVYFNSMTCHMSWQKLCAELSHSDQIDVFIDTWHIINLNLVVKRQKTDYQIL